MFAAYLKTQKIISLSPSLKTKANLKRLAFVFGHFTKPNQSDLP